MGLSRQDTGEDAVERGGTPDQSDELEEQWGTARQRFADYLKTLTEADLGRFATRHPPAGPVTVDDSIGLMQSHFDHPLRQIRRGGKAEGFLGKSA